MEPTSDRLPPPLPPRSPAFADVPYAMLVPPPVDPRPASVRTLAILGMVFGSFALLSPLTTAMQLMTPVDTRAMLYTPGRPLPTTLPAAFNPAAEMYARPMLPWTIGMQAIGFAMGAWLLWAAIQAFRLRDRGRRAMLVYAVAAIAFALVAGAANATYVMPVLFAGLATPRGPLPAGVVCGIAIAVGVLGAIVGTIYPAFILVLFRRPNVISAFDRNAVVTPTPAGIDVAS